MKQPFVKNNKLLKNVIFLNFKESEEQQDTLENFDNRENGLCLFLHSYVYIIIMKLCINFIFTISSRCIFTVDP